MIVYFGRCNNVVEKMWIYQFIVKNFYLSYKSKVCDELDIYIIYVYIFICVYLV